MEGWNNGHGRTDPTFQYSNVPAFRHGSIPAFQSDGLRRTKRMGTGVSSLKFQVSSKSGRRPVVRLWTSHFKLATRPLRPCRTKPISGRVSSGKCEVSSGTAVLQASNLTFQTRSVTNKANLSWRTGGHGPLRAKGGERGRSPYCAKQSQMWEEWDIWGMSASWAGRPCHRGGCAKQSQLGGWKCEV
jgi:hypothetical protein